jgi:hypothetical protein
MAMECDGDDDGNDDSDVNYEVRLWHCYDVAFIRRHWQI